MFRKQKPARVEPATPPRPVPEPGAPLFDPAWYARRAVHPAADPREDYLARGTEAARSPAPLFSPAWYRAANPDVEVARKEPLLHWLAHGWREGRDPSALFSTRAYLEAHPGLAGGETDPLSHWLSAGRAAGARPHPRIEPFDPAAPDIALVMVHEGDAASLDLALWALAAAQGAAPVTVYLVDDGTGPARGEAEALAAARRGPALDIRRLSEPSADGVGACANAGLWAALQERRHTHVGLLEQACLVGRGLIDGLVDLWAPLAAPALNLARTAQAVPIDFDIYATGAPLDAVDAFGARRRALIPGAVDLAEAVEPACLLFQRGALEAAGLLDAGARDPLAGLAPMLERLARAGLGGPVVARHLYAHRLERSPAVVRRAACAPGGGPLALCDGMPVTAATAAAALRSEAADRRALRAWSPAAPGLLAAHAERTRGLTEALSKSATRTAERLARLDAAAGAAALPRGAGVLCAWDEIGFGDAPRPPRAGDPAGYRAVYRAVQQRVWAELALREQTSFAAFTGMQPLTANLAALSESEPPVLVLTMDTDPVTGDEKDGYVQRVIAIDTVLAPRTRLYLKMVAARDRRPALVFLADGIWRLEIAHRCPLGEALLAAVLALGAPVYSQSLVGIDPPVVRRLLPDRRGPLLMDMHGAVPEEFVLYRNHYMAQKYARYEAWAAGQADTIVCVTEAMADHFAAKLALPRSRMLVCPIFLHTATTSDGGRAYNDRPRAIYAGGTQRWQMIPELARLVAATREGCDWILLTPDPDGMGRALDREGVPQGASGLAVRAASQAEVFATYPRCDFGLLLREDCVVNRVACPTKLVEYLRFGVVPVLATPHVGDFAALGMRFVAAADFRAGRVPGPAERAAMAAANRALLARLLDAAEDGKRRIARAVAGARTTERTDTRIRSTA